MSKVWTFVLIVMIFSACSKAPGILAPKSHYPSLENSEIQQGQLLESLIDQAPRCETELENSEENRIIEEFIKLGKRNIKWRNHLSRSYPNLNFVFNIDVSPHNPYRYGPAQFARFYKNIESSIPTELKETLWSNTSEFPDQIEIDINEYRKWSSLINLHFHYIARWRSIICPNIHEYYRRKIYHIRSYILIEQQIEMDSRFLSKLPAQSIKNKSFYRELLIELCELNNRSKEDCKEQVEDAFIKENLAQYYQDIKAVGKNTEDYLFKIHHVHHNQFQRSQDTIELNLYSQVKAQDYDFIQSAIESSWSQHGLDLKLKNQLIDDLTPTVQDGDTPVAYVTQDYRSMIIPREPIYRTKLKKMSAHEFGHILGFKDCYVEFADQETREVTYYLLRKGDIMCDLNGHVEAHHIQKIKESYK